MKLSLLAAIAALGLTALPAFAHDFKIGDLIVDHPMAFETAKTAKAGGGYLSVTNTGDTADRLIAVRADFPKVALHTTIEEDGIAKMRHLDAIDLPAGETISLAPGGMHVMFMGLSDPFEAGAKIPATLIFETAGELDVVFNVEERGGHDHGAEDHSDHSNHSATN